MKTFESIQSLITVLADAIERQEGYRDAHGNPITTGAPYKRKNGGSIWDNMPKRIWPQYPIDASGFLILPSYEVGRKMLEQQLAIKIRRGETLEQIISEWDSGDSAPTRAEYLAHVVEWTGLPTDTSLRRLAMIDV